MKLIIKKISGLAVLFCMALVLIYWSDLKKAFIKDRFYIVFNTKLDAHTSVGYNLNDSLYPKKNIRIINGIKEYSVGVANGLFIEFMVLDSSEIKAEKIKDLNVISLDSLLQLIPDLHYTLPKNETKKLNPEFYIIDQDYNRTMKIKVVPIVSIYD